MTSKLNVFSAGLALVCGLTGGTVSYVVGKDYLPQQIEGAVNVDMKGIPVVIELQRVASLIQQHGALQQAVFGGSDKALGEMASKEKEIEAQLKKVGGLPDIDRLVGSAAMDTIRADIGEYMKVNVSDTTPTKAAETRTEILGRIYDAMRTVGNNEGWSNQSFPKSTVIFQAATLDLVSSMESIARLRGVGTRMLRSDEATTSTDREILAPQTNQLNKSKILLIQKNNEMLSFLPSKAGDIKAFEDFFIKGVNEMLNISNEHLMTVMKKGRAPSADYFLQKATALLTASEKAMQSVYLESLKQVFPAEVSEVKTANITKQGLVFGLGGLLTLLSTLGGFVFGRFLTKE